MAVDDVFAKDYWSAPSITPDRKGDLNAGKIYFAVGNATTMWEMIEDALGMLLVVLANTNTTSSNAIVKHMFGVIESSSQRLKMLEAVAELYFASWWEREEVRKPFRQLMNAVSKGAWRRNEFAHGKVLDFSSVKKDIEGKQQEIAHGSFLVAPDYMIARQRAPYSHWDFPEDRLPTVMSNYRYTSSDIMSFVKKFQHLHEAIYEYLQGCKMEGGYPANVLKLIASDAEKAASAQLKAEKRNPSPNKKD